jgi:hypothetical protein
MQELGGKQAQHSWSKVELDALQRALARHGRNWTAVASSVGSKTKRQCWNKVDAEVAAGRMQELGGKQAQHSWSKVELDALELAVARHGRDWVAVASSVGSKTALQCSGKVRVEVAAGRIQEIGGKQVYHSWSKVELDALELAVAPYPPSRSPYWPRATRTSPTPSPRASTCCSPSNYLLRCSRCSPSPAIRPS